MATITWPTRLQKYFDEQGFSYAAGEGAVRTQMQVGLPESRPLVSDVVWTASGTIKIPFREFPVLTEFYENELKNGSLRFQKADPVNNSVAWQWRFTKPFVASGFGGGYLLIQMELERIPATDETILPPSVSLPSSMALVEGEFVTIHATASHYDSLVWYHAEAGIPDAWVEVHGETGVDLIIPHAHHGDDLDRFKVVATNVNGSTTSNVLTLHVVKIAPVFTHPFTTPIEWMDKTPIQPYSMAPHFDSGGDVDSYVLHGFPAGITIDSLGVLHGTPDGVTDNPHATVEAINSVGNAVSNEVDVNVVAAIPAPRFDHTIADMMAVVGEAFTQDVSPRFMLGGHVDSYSLQNAPAGMVIDNAGEISWPNPVKGDTAGVTVTAHNASGDAVSNAFGVDAAVLGVELAPPLDSCASTGAGWICDANSGEVHDGTWYFINLGWRGSITVPNVLTVGRRYQIRFSSNKEVQLVLMDQTRRFLSAGDHVLMLTSKIKDLFFGTWTVTAGTEVSNISVREIL